MFYAAMQSICRGLINANEQSIIMKNKKTLNLLRYIAAGIGGLVSMGSIPLVPEEYSVAIIGFAVALKPLFEKIGDFLDNKKFDGSFKIK